MTGPAPAAPTAETCRRLLELARAQGEALADGEVEAFARLTEQRESLQRAFDAPLPAELLALARTTLEQVAALDQRSAALGRRLLDETRQDLRQLRAGRTALDGYGRPGAHLGPRPTRLDRAG